MRTRLLILLLVSAACLVSSAQASESPNLFPVQEGFVDSHGALIYYQSVGRGTPLMIVHGGPGASHDYFLPYLLPLMRTSRLVFIDERGSGKSSKFEDPRDRDRVSALEATGLFGKGEIWEHGRYSEEYAKLAWGKGYFPYVYQNRPDPNYDPLSSNTSTAWDVYREMWGSDGEFIVDGNLREVEYVDRLSEIKVPTLVIVGEHDESDPKMSKEMHEKIAGSQLVILPNSGHMTFVDQPEQFLKAVRDFV